MTSSLNFVHIGRTERTRPRLFEYMTYLACLVSCNGELQAFRGATSGFFHLLFCECYPLQSIALPLFIICTLLYIFVFLSMRASVGRLHDGCGGHAIRERMLSLVECLVNINVPSYLVNIHVRVFVFWSPVVVCCDCQLLSHVNVSLSHCFILRDILNSSASEPPCLLRWVNTT